MDPTPLISADEYQKLFKLDDWNDVVIIAKGNHIRHYTNGRLVMDFKDSEERALKTGNLGLQLHAGKPMWANIAISGLKTCLSSLRRQPPGHFGCGLSGLLPVI